MLAIYRSVCNKRNQKLVWFNAFPVNGFALLVRFPCWDSLEDSLEMFTLRTLLNARKSGFIAWHIMSKASGEEFC